ncbi:DUF5983 family protein [Flavisphingomonas formosensis]|uniref:DUF5983 family protein n=1 Tax=Flavisphingomonas formosensis TaxID=861534 RepID=UPI0012FA7DAC|nr:hypothetical protein [Sphingomonas formosensis]
MEIGRYIVLSTAHLRCATAELLTEWSQLPPSAQPLAPAPTQCGWFLSTRDSQGLQNGQLPDELAPILAFGRACGCAYILFDCDGPEEDALPTFPW